MMKSKKEKGHTLVANIVLQDFAKENWPDLALYAFSRNGRLLTKQTIKKDPKQPGKGTARFALDAHLKNVIVKVGPDVEDTRSLERLQVGVQSVNLAEVKSLDFELPHVQWICWLKYLYTVTGMVKKQGTNPMAPICAGEVDIYDVDPLWCILRLPDSIIERMREGIIDLLIDPPHRYLPVEVADPPRPWWKWDPSEITDIKHSQAAIRQQLDELPEEWAFAKKRYDGLAASRARFNTELNAMNLAERRAFMDSEAVAGVKVSQVVNSNTKQFRELLVKEFMAFRFYLCWWPWIYWTWWPYCWYSLEKLGTASLQADGSFTALVPLSVCRKDTPDLWFVVRQTIGGVERVIYRRYPVPCNTYWNHPSGDPVTLIVTDPDAVACRPPADDLPTEEFVMPMGIYEDEWYEINQAHIKAAVDPTTPLPTDCGLYEGTDPYGTRLDLRMMFHDNLRTLFSATTGIQYYRWSYRLHGTTEWTQIDTQINHRHLVYMGGGNYQVHSEKIGPYPVGGENNLFMVPDPNKAWLNNRNDLAFAIWHTARWDSDNNTYVPTIPDGKYDLRLEMFDQAGVRQDPATAGFKFMLMTGTVGVIDDNLTVESDGSLIMHLHLDNRKVRADIMSIKLNSTPPIGECQFLEYSSKSADIVNVEYEAYHPEPSYNFLASYVLRVRRGVSGSTQGYLSSTIPVRPPGTDQPFAVSDLLDTFDRCAFTATLHAYPRARNGHGRIRDYEASDVAAFAMVPAPSE